VAEAVPTAVGEARTEAVHTDTKFQNLQPAPNFGAGFFVQTFARRFSSHNSSVA
jgi:hypothetical protein